VKGGIAQLVERLLCKQDVSGSSPLTSTSSWVSTRKKFSIITVESENAGKIDQQQNLENCITSKKRSHFLVREK
jgi:hypothetical protein